eukprot:gene28839-50737_t
MDQPAEIESHTALTRRSCEHGASRAARRHAGRMERTVSAHLECHVTEPIDLVLSLAVADGPQRRDESLSVTLDGEAIAVTEIADDHGTRLHVADAVPVGALVVDYNAVVTSSAPTVEVRPVDLIRYLRPSRYCESDKLSAVAH